MEVLHTNGELAIREVRRSGCQEEVTEDDKVCDVPGLDAVVVGTQFLYIPSPQRDGHEDAERHDLGTVGEHKAKRGHLGRHNTKDFRPALWPDMMTESVKVGTLAKSFAAVISGR